MDEALEKMKAALNTGKKVSLKVCGRKISLYPSVRSEKTQFTLCWYDGINRCRKQSFDKEIMAAEISRVLSAIQSGYGFATRLDISQIQRFARADMEIPGVPIEDLIAFYKRHHDVNLNQIKVPDMVKTYMESAIANNRSIRHVETLRSHLSSFASTFQCPIRKITVQELDNYLAGIPNPKTRINHRTSIAALFNYAQRKGYLPADCPTAAQGTERPETPVSEPGILSPDDFTALLGACEDPNLRAFLLIGGLAGCRSAEIQRLTWGDVRDDVIVLGPNITKTRRRRMAEVCLRLRNALAPLRGNPTEIVTYRDPSWLYEKMRRLVGETGISFPPNCLRHSFVSYHLELHRDPPRTAKSSGHSLQILETSYLKLVDREAAERWFNLETTS